jgi:hypothetical protein
MHRGRFALRGSRRSREATAAGQPQARSATAAGDEKVATRRLPLLPFGEGGDFAASSCRWQRADYSSSPLSFDPEHLDPRQGLARQQKEKQSELSNMGERSRDSGLKRNDD